MVLEIMKVTRATTVIIDVDEEEVVVEEVVVVVEKELEGKEMVEERMKERDF